MNRVLKLLPFAIGLLTAGAVLLATSCGSSSTGSRLRAMNGSPSEASLDLLLNNSSVATGIAYGAASSYVGVSTGSQQLQLNTSGTSTAVLSQTVTVVAKTDYTLIVANLAPNITSFLLTDDNSAPVSGDLKMRIVNAAPNLGSADVYVVAPGTSLATVSANVTSLGYLSASSYLSLAAGSYEVVFTQPGTKSVVIDSGNGGLSFTAGQVRTVVGLNGLSGGFTVGVLADVN